MTTPKKVLGIETSCDETAAAVVEGPLDRGAGRVLSDVVRTQIELHAPFGGVVPEVAARDHAEWLPRVVTKALDDASCTLADLDGIAVTSRPGLSGALLVGLSLAKGLAWGSGLPLVGVDHLLGHILAVFLRRGAEASALPEFPFAALVASGGHTAIYEVNAPSSAAVRELGATRDDAAGEAFDKFAKLVGLGYPGGPVVDRLAATGDASRSPVELPRPMAHKSGSNFEMSFSGIKSAVARYVETHGAPTGQALADLAAAFQATVVGTLADKTVRAARHAGLRRIVIGGGVSANRGLRAALAARARDLELFIPPLASCTDNAAMIAYTGAVQLARGERSDLSLAAATKTSLERVTRKGAGKRPE
ncbi:MAG: tRNA (adenosine(37)-N6)-threonylcarbamoyltransferase complex transferase subunit TsaD [Polyangiaceae bacterium]